MCHVVLTNIVIIQSFITEISVISDIDFEHRL